jgi:malate permease and related proteins
MIEVLERAFPFFILIAAGFVSKKAGIFTKDNATVLSNFVFNITLPALIFISLISIRLDSSVLKLAAAAMILILASYVLTLIVMSAMKIPGKQRGVILISVTILNSGIFGLPIAEIALGREATAAMAVMNFVNTLFGTTVAYFFAAHYGRDKKSDRSSIVLKVLKMPLMWSVVLGLLFNVFSIGLPLYVGSSLKYMADATTAAALIFAGVYLEWKLPALRMLVPFVLLRHAFGFLCGLAIAHVLGMTGNARSSLLLFACLPAGIMTIIYSVSEKLDIELASSVVAISSIIYIISMPLLLLI